MHRSLIIQLGGVFDDAMSELRDEYLLRTETGMSDDSVVRFMDAPPEAVGNLSKPIEVLRERLQRTLSDCARDLLQVGDSLGGEIVWDVFFLLNVGEPLVANAASVVFEMLETLVATEYETIFASHKRGSSRRLRFVPIAIVPSASDCKQGRPAAIEELNQFHQRILESKEAAQKADGREFPVDRIFVLDAVTPYGVLQVADLIDQVSNFVRYVLYSGARTAPEFALVFDSVQNDLFASFGCASMALDIGLVSDVLTYRASLDAARFFNRTEDVGLSDPVDILPNAILTDAERLASAIDEVRSLPERTIEADGIASLDSLGDLYTQLVKRLDTLAEHELVLAEEERSEAARALEKSGQRTTSPWLWICGASFVLGAAVFAVGFWYIVLPIATAVAAGAAFSLVTAMALGLMTSLMGSEDEEKPTSKKKLVEEDSSESETHSRLELVIPVVAESKRRIDGLRYLFDTLERSATDELSEKSTTVENERRFKSSLANQSLVDLWYENVVGTIDTLANSYLETLRNGSDPLARDLLSGEVVPDVESLREHVRGVTKTLLTKLFDKPEYRSEVERNLLPFLKGFPNGVPIFLEGKSRQQFDPTGFIHPVQNVAYVHDILQTATERSVDSSGTPFRVEAASEIFDVLLMTVTIDIHPDAISILNEKT